MPRHFMVEGICDQGKKLTGMPKTFWGCSADMVAVVKVFPLNKKKGLRGD